MLSISEHTFVAALDSFAAGLFEAGSNVQAYVVCLFKDFMLMDILLSLARSWAHELAMLSPDETVQDPFSCATFLTQSMG
jgi:hypothetical protein